MYYRNYVCIYILHFSNYEWVFFTPCHYTSICPAFVFVIFCQPSQTIFVKPISFDLTLMQLLQILIVSIMTSVAKIATFSQGCNQSYILDSSPVITLDRKLRSSFDVQLMHVWIWWLYWSVGKEHALLQFISITYGLNTCLYISQ